MRSKYQYPALRESTFKRWFRINFDRANENNHPQSLRRVNALKELFLFRKSIVKLFSNLQEVESFYQTLCNGNHPARYGDGMHDAIRNKLRGLSDIRENNIRKEAERKTFAFLHAQYLSEMRRGDRNDGPNITYAREQLSRQNSR